MGEHPDPLGELVANKYRLLEAENAALVEIAKRFRDGQDIDHQPDGRWVWYVPNGASYSDIKVETRPPFVAALAAHFGSNTPQIPKDKT